MELSFKVSSPIARTLFREAFCRRKIKHTNLCWKTFTRVCVFICFFSVCLCVHLLLCCVGVFFLPFLFYFRLFNISFILLSHCLGSDTNQYLQSVILYIKLIFSFFNFNETFPPNFASHTLVRQNFLACEFVSLFSAAHPPMPGKWDFLLLFTLILF